MKIKRESCNRMWYLPDSGWLLSKKEWSDGKNLWQYFVRKLPRPLNSCLSGKEIGSTFNSRQQRESRSWFLKCFFFVLTNTFLCLDYHNCKVKHIVQTDAFFKLELCPKFPLTDCDSMLWRQFVTFCISNLIQPWHSNFNTPSPPTHPRLVVKRKTNTFCEESCEINRTRMEGIYMIVHLRHNCTKQDFAEKKFNLCWKGRYVNTKWSRPFKPPPPKKNKQMF